MPHPNSAVLIVNTRSRRGQEWFRMAKAGLEARGVELESAWPLRSPKEISARTCEAVERGIGLVIVGGGDGTLSSVAGYFPGSSSVMGVLPMGTGNQFARDLQIPSDVDAACRILAEGRDVAVDMGVAGDSYFLNVVTVGLTTLIAQSLTVKEKRRLGRLVYIVALARALRRIRPFVVTLTTDEGKLTFETLQVVIGNGRFHAGPFPLAPDAHITNGKLVVYAVAGTSRWRLLKYALHLPGGHQVDLPEVPAFLTVGGRLETTPSRSVIVDGEKGRRTPFEFRSAPAALRVRVPEDFTG